MNEATDQISVYDQVAAYFIHVPMWPFVLLAAAGVVAGIYDLISRRRRTEVAEYFRATFLSVLAGLYPEPNNWPKSIDTYLCARLPTLEAVFRDFRQLIQQDRLAVYNRDWERYCQFCREEITDDKCAAAELDHGKSTDPKKVFHTLVTNLLRHTE